MSEYRRWVVACGGQEKPFKAMSGHTCGVQLQGNMPTTT